MKLLLGVFTFMLVCYAGVASLRGSSQVLPAVHFVESLEDETTRIDMPQLT